MRVGFAKTAQVVVPTGNVTRREAHGWSFREGQVESNGKGADMPLHDLIGPNDRLIMVVGTYGSGKTEVAVNLAIQLAVDGRRVQLADLDIVNPYFRSREARRLMEEHGVRVVIPPGAQAFADLPIILPEIQGMLHPPPGTVTLFDVGGDDAGAKVLSSLRPAIGRRPLRIVAGHQLQAPLHGHAGRVPRDAACRSRRPRGCTVTGLLVNSHLIEHTTAQTVLEGWRLALEVSQRSGRPVRCVAVMEEVAGDPALAEIDAPILPHAAAYASPLDFIPPAWITSNPRTNCCRPPDPSRSASRDPSTCPVRKENKVGRIEIERGRCKGCSRCIVYCPKDLLEFSDDLNERGYRYVVSSTGTEEDCTGCTLCAVACPDQGIEAWSDKGKQMFEQHDGADGGHDPLLPRLHARRRAHRIVAEVIEELGLHGRAVGIAPVGCSVLAYEYFNFDMFEAAHGRAPAVATGAKRARPDSIVFTYQGDGDLASIGGNEILHAANRGEKFTVIFINNAIYGMTGGQMAPTTMPGQRTTTSPFGPRRRGHGTPAPGGGAAGDPADAGVHRARGGRTTPSRRSRRRSSIKKAFEYQRDNVCFSFVEILSTCPTNWGLSPSESDRRGWRRR